MDEQQQPVEEQSEIVVDPTFQSIELIQNMLNEAYEEAVNAENQTKALMLREAFAFFNGAVNSLSITTVLSQIVKHLNTLAD